MNKELKMKIAYWTLFECGWFNRICSFGDATL